MRHSLIAALLLPLSVNLAQAQTADTETADPGNATNAEVGKIRMGGALNLTSQYLWRGVQLTADTALQGGVDFRADSGLHAGLFTSSIANGTETRGTLGIAGQRDEWRYDFGARLYYLPQFDDSNFAEIYGLALWKALEFGLALSPDAGTYLHATYRRDLESDWNLELHLGSFDVDRDGGVTIPTEDYVDYHVALGRELERRLSAKFTLAGTTLDAGEAPMQTDNFRTLISLTYVF